MVVGGGEGARGTRVWDHRARGLLPSHTHACTSPHTAAHAPPSPHNGACAPPPPACSQSTRPHAPHHCAQLLRRLQPRLHCLVHEAGQARVVAQEEVLHAAFAAGAWAGGTRGCVCGGGWAGGAKGDAGMAGAAVGAVRRGCCCGVGRQERCYCAGLLLCYCVLQPRAAVCSSHSRWIAGGTVQRRLPLKARAHPPVVDARDAEHGHAYGCTRTCAAWHRLAAGSVHGCQQTSTHPHIHACVAGAHAHMHARMACVHCINTEVRTPVILRLAS